MTSKQAVTYVQQMCFFFSRGLIHYSSSLYRRSLKLALDWAVQRYIWRGQAQYIRSLFEANKDAREPRQQRVSHKRPFSSLSWGQVSENITRYFYKRQRHCWRNGSTPTRTGPPQLQAVRVPYSFWQLKQIFTIFNRFEIREEHSTTNPRS